MVVAWHYHCSRKKPKAVPIQPAKCVAFVHNWVIKHYWTIYTVCCASDDSIIAHCYYMYILLCGMPYYYSSLHIDGERQHSPSSSTTTTKCFFCVYRENRILKTLSGIFEFCLLPVNISVYTCNMYRISFWESGPLKTHKKTFRWCRWRWWRTVPLSINISPIAILRYFTLHNLHIVTIYNDIITISWKKKALPDVPTSRNCLDQYDIILVLVYRSPPCPSILLLKFVFNPSRPHTSILGVFNLLELRFSPQMPKEWLKNRGPVRSGINFWK